MAKEEATYYLAVDIGASSGRHILFSLQNGKIASEEIYRFENGMKKKDGKLLWDTDRLFAEIINGMKRCGEVGKIPTTMAIDTWAVDYVLLDENDKVLGDTFGYRDSRTDGMDEEVRKWISDETLYEKTGIQKQIFNTIYQLTADRMQRPEVLNQAKTFLMLPDYFTFRLTGQKASEYTNATSTQLVSPFTKQWDMELIRTLKLPTEIFLPLKQPGNSLGNLKPEIAEEIGFDCEVLQCATHDTASAVMAMPWVVENRGAATENLENLNASATGGTGDFESALYISSGTWSLMGTELPEALCDTASQKGNFTNEGGYDYRFRYLKNIMGLWMIQSVRHETNDAYTFAELAKMAEENDDFPSLVDANDPSFLSPQSAGMTMTEAVKAYCKNTNQRVPENIGELAAVIYKSLAKCYGETVQKIEANTEQNFDTIYIIGGGCNNDYLNRLTAKTTGKKVSAGPSEATAIGNALSQMIAKGDIRDLATAREMVAKSFDIRVYK